MSHSRRQFLQGSSYAVTAVAGAAALASTSVNSKANEHHFQTLTAVEVITLESFAELIVPGAREAGVAHYIDAQLSVSDPDSLLMLRYLGVPLDQFKNFYQAGLASCMALAVAKFATKDWSTLSMEQRLELVQLIGSDAFASWTGPPSSFFQFVIRADACDVVYGTKAGIERIGMPHMAHINAVREW
ncbi:MAG: gluconate 2-dehydrogenase subunit 3 family protein [Pseudomonadales bacterium]